MKMYVFHLFSIILLLLATPAAAQMPYHPWRSINGTNYCVAALYQWQTNRASPRPLSAWIAPDFHNSFIVEQVLTNRILIVRWHYSDAMIDKDMTTFALTNYPLHDKVWDGQKIEFFAMRSGIWRGVHTSGAPSTLPLYDYAVPVQPPGRVPNKTPKP